MNDRIKTLILALSLLLLAACQPPAADTGDVATPTGQPTAPGPVMTSQHVQLEAVRGTCTGEVDVVVAGVPTRLALDFQGDVGGASAVGSAEVVMQFASLTCELGTDGRRCAAGPGRLPFIPSAPQAAAAAPSSSEPDPDAE